MTETYEGDVRIVAEDPSSVDLWISENTTLAALHDRHPQPCDGYEEGAIVPDIDTLRPCTAEELGRFVVAASGEYRTDDPSLVFYIPPSKELAMRFRASPRLYGLTTCDPHMLTTTPNADTGERPGLHIDEEAKDDKDNEGKHRVGINFGPGDRRLVVVTHSTSLLFPGLAAPNTRTVREHLAVTPTYSLHLTIPPYALYVAYTGIIDEARGCVVHEGSMWNMHKQSLVGFHPVPHLEFSV